MREKKMIRHMGMTMTEEEHRRWHQEHEGKNLTATEHQELMEHLGVGREDDRKWHAKLDARQRKPRAESAPGVRPVDVFAIGGGFLEYCVKQGWLIRLRSGRSTVYHVTEAGRGALAGFGITKY